MLELDVGFDDEYGFEDAEEFQEDETITNTQDQEQMKSLGKFVVLSDCPEERLTLPCMRDTRLRAGVFLSILKDLVGKDITKFSMPVLLNEPLSNLQKTVEFLCFNDLLLEA